MTTVTAAHLLLPSPSESHDQLNADLRAVLSSDASADGRILVGRPSILRRLAARIAESVGPEIDRLMSGDGPDAQLATAVSVHTGVAMAVVDADGAVSGEIHPGERILTVSVFAAADAQGLSEAIAERGATRVNHIHAIDLPVRSAPVSTVTASGLPSSDSEEER